VVTQDIPHDAEPPSVKVSCASSAWRLPVEEKPTEAVRCRLRRMAERRGLQLQKSRRRDPRAYDYGTYRLVDARTNTVIAYAGYNDHGLTLNQIKDYLTGDDGQ
jgi:hypothetical protein